MTSLRLSALLSFAFACLLARNASGSLPVGPMQPATLRNDAAAASAPAALSPTGASPSAKSVTSAELREEIRNLARRGLLDSALALCRRALEIDSTDTFARFMAGKLAPEGKASAEYFKRVVEAGRPGPELEESRFRLGQYHYAAGKYHLAIPYFRDYLKLHPKGDWKEPTLYWMGLACLALAQSRPDRAAYVDTGMAYFQRLLEASPPERYYHALALAGVGKARMAQGDWTGAWEAVKGALEKAPEDEKAAMLLLAAQLRRPTDRAEERALLVRLATEHPQSPEVKHLRKLNGIPDPAKWRAPAVPGMPKTLPSDTAKRTAGSDSAKPAAGAGAAAPTNPPAAPAAARTGGFTLQLGAFAQAANAQGMMTDLAKQGFAPELAEGSRGGKKIYQVRLGRFATAEEAQEYARAHLKPRKVLSQAVPVP